MPGMTGLRLYRTIRADQRLYDVPVTILKRVVES
jgi:CheY-like chemotaxis protein